MSKQKQLKERIEQLEKELSELKSQLLTLAMRPYGGYAYVFYQQPVYQPYYIQPPLQTPNYPIITYNSGSHFQ